MFNFNKLIRHTQVDIDEELLQRNIDRVAPFLADYIRRREVATTVNVYRGSIAEPHKCLTNTDCVIGIELLVHK